tara:strand:+ start:96229 stop:96666 length:438 start_codon:yes stop_codon:yes gene_type:complete
MQKLYKNSITKISARLLLVASLLFVWFGNGVHIHSQISHIFDHGDVHVYVHVHDNSDSGSQNDHHASNPEDDQHIVATVDLFGVLSQSRTLATQTDLMTSIVTVVPDWDFNAGSVIVYEFNLPPPDKSSSEFLSSSFSLRAPPLA